MITGNFFVTPHAVRQFQDRVAFLPYDEVVGLIVQSLDEAPPGKVSENGKALQVRVSEPFDFRAVIVPGNPPDQPKPVVVTILKSGKPRHRQAKLASYLAQRT